MKFKEPGEIEAESMRIISSELEKMGKNIPEDRLSIVRRVIHTTADFDFADNLVFSEDAVEAGTEAVRKGTTIITDTNMTLAGINKTRLGSFGCRTACYMSDEDVAAMAKQEGVTRAVCSVRKAVQNDPGCIYAVGNAPTALFEIADAIEGGFRPALVIGVPVGFVNVVESKEHIIEVCRRFSVPYIVALGRKGGSTVSCAICNALVIEAGK